MISIPAVSFEWHPSRRLRVWSQLMLVLAWLAIALSGAPLGLKGLLVSVAGGAWMRCQHRTRTSLLRALHWSGSGQWAADLYDGRNLPARLLSFRVWGDYILLYLMIAEIGRCGVLLGPDNLDAANRRRLRMRLARL